MMAVSMFWLSVWLRFSTFYALYVYTTGSLLEHPILVTMGLELPYQNIDVEKCYHTYRLLRVYGSQSAMAPEIAGTL